MTKRNGRARGAYPDEGPTIDHDRARALTSKQPRIEYIADLMARGQYVTRRTAHELAEVWGLQFRTIQGEYVGAAAAVMRASLGSAEELRTSALCTLEHVRTRCASIAREALAKRKEHVAARFFEVSIQAANGLLSFASRDFDERAALAREARDVEKHQKAMGPGEADKDAPPRFVVELTLAPDAEHELERRFADRPAVLAEVRAALGMANGCGAGPAASRAAS